MKHVAVRLAGRLGICPSTLVAGVYWVLWCVVVSGERFRLLVHPLCPTSRSLVKDLAGRGLLGRLDIVLLDRPVALGRVFPWSVPLLVSPGGDPVAMDPLDAETVQAIVEGRGLSVDDEKGLFAKSILYSAYASSIALVHRSLRPMLDESFLGPALRLVARGRFLSEAREGLEPVLDDLYVEERERIARALSVSIVRHLWYSGASLDQLENIGEETVGALILSMASMGRAFLPLTPTKPDMTGFITAFIRRRARGLLAKVQREHQEITSDREYQQLLGISLR